MIWLTRRPDHPYANILIDNLAKRQNHSTQEAAIATDPGSVCLWVGHSDLRLFTGLAVAARMA